MNFPKWYYMPNPTIACFCYMHIAASLAKLAVSIVVMHTDSGWHCEIFFWYISLFDIGFVNLFYDFCIQKPHYFYIFWIQKFVCQFLEFMDPETAVFLRFLDPKTAPFLQFLDPDFFLSISTISGSRNCGIFAVSRSRNSNIFTISGGPMDHGGMSA